MRPALALVALLSSVSLAGCSGSTDDPGAGAPGPSEATPPVVVFQAAKYTGWSGSGDTTVQGQKPVPWNAGVRLGLPLAFSALLVEMRCDGQVQQGDEQRPGLFVEVAYDAAGGGPVATTGGENDDDCTDLTFAVGQADVGYGQGQLRSVVASAPYGGATVGANSNIEFAISVFLAGDVPPGYTAFLEPMPTQTKPPR